ncbi:MAG: SHOCT domain-containing protein [Nitrospiraceae bacterium]|nr:MAG: SHOCT domain-containing protein [Nitrospiraceae bacterium]
MGKLEDNSLFKSIFVAFLILFMHVILIAGVGILILLFYGIINHMVWMITGIVLISIWGYLFYRKVIEDGKELRNVVGDLKGKNVEIKLLGGLARFRMSDPAVNQQLSHLSKQRPKELTAPETDNVKALNDLSRLYEKNLITRDEYEKAKKDIFE